MIDTQKREVFSILAFCEGKEVKRTNLWSREVNEYGIHNNQHQREEKQNPCKQSFDERHKVKTRCPVDGVKNRMLLYQTINLVFKKEKKKKSKVYQQEIVYLSCSTL